MSKNRKGLIICLRLEVVWKPDYYNRNNTEITLAQDVEDFIQKQVRDGVCADASDLVNNGLRTIRDQKLSPFTVTPELEAWLLEAADQPSTPLTSADFGRPR